MKKRFFICVLTLCCLTFLNAAGCNISVSDSGKNATSIPHIDNAKDLKEYTPTEDDEYEEGYTYYTSVSVDLVTEVNGNYTTGRPFVIDEQNENKRIYRNVYLYVGDFFQIIYYANVNNLGKIFAIMSDKTDEEYAEIYYENGKPLQIDVKKQGVYNLILDVTTFGIDMEKIGDIETPVYETIKSCELDIHVSESNYEYFTMELNRETNEFHIQKQIPANAIVVFFNAAHTGRYKITIDDGIKDKFVYASDSESGTVVHIGGVYDVYLNAKTYVMRLELTNPDTSTYYCQVGFGENVVLNCTDSATPYLFVYEFNAQGASGEYVKIPKFYPELGMPYKLTVNDDNGLTYVASSGDAFVKKSGLYGLTVDLKRFTITVEKFS